MKIHAPRHARGLVHLIRLSHVPKDANVQVFVRSYRTNLFYPQKPPVSVGKKGELAGRIVLGDEDHDFGFYSVVAVDLDQKSTWDPVASLPAGAPTKTKNIVRTGV